MSADACASWVILTLATLAWPITSSLRLEKLLIEKEKRETKIRDYGTKINKLWDKLMVPIDEREEFFERSTQTLGPSAIKSVRHTALPSLSRWFALTRADFSARTSSNASSRCTGIR